MRQATAEPPTAAERDQVPPDIATMRKTVNILLDPDAVPEALPPGAEELARLTLQMRGHVQLLAPMVAQAARETCEPGSVSRYTVLGCVWEAESRLAAEPNPRFGGALGYARRLARVLNALCDHHEQLGGEPR